MKPSQYNFVWPTDDPSRVMIFNSLSTALAEVAETHIGLLRTSHFDYSLLTENEREFVDGLREGGFVVDDAADELGQVKCRYNSDKYDRTRLRLVVAPTLACNFACPYCFEQTEKQHSGRSGVMTKTVQEELLKYIERATDTMRSLFVTWYGGEPLLAKATISELSEKIVTIAKAKSVSYSAGMITNGYLLAKDPEVVHELKRSKIRFVHVTLDGPPEVHNARRMLKGNGGPTFDQILEGVKLLKANEIEVFIRVNIDHTNSASLSATLDIFKSNGLTDSFVYLGQVSPYTDACKSYESSCVLTEEFTGITHTFCEELSRRGFKEDRDAYYPRLARACDANRMNAIVVDPDGDMYKCWTQVGDKRARIGRIGETEQPSESERIRQTRWVTWEPFEYSDCVNCRVLPICMGGCAFQAMVVNDGHPQCKEWKYGLEKYVRHRFNLEKQARGLHKDPSLRHPHSDIRKDPVEKS